MSHTHDGMSEAPCQQTDLSRTSWPVTSHSGGSSSQKRVQSPEAVPLAQEVKPSLPGLEHVHADPEAGDRFVIERGWKVTLRLSKICVF